MKTNQLEKILNYSRYLHLYTFYIFERIYTYYLPYILIDEAGSRINMAHFNSRMNMYYYGKQKDTYSSKIHGVS